MKRKVFEININYFDFNNNITQSGFLTSSGFGGREALESRQGNLKNCNFLNYRPPLISLKNCKYGANTQMNEHQIQYEGLQLCKCMSV